MDSQLLFKLLLILGIFCIICVFFKDQIKVFISKLSNLTLTYENGKVSVHMNAEKNEKWGEGVKQLQVPAQSVAANMATSGVKPEVHKDIYLSGQSERDAVLLSWGEIKQTVFDAYAARKLPLIPAMGLQDAIQKLADSGAINSDLQNLLNVLNNLGKEIAADSSIKPIKADARVYMELANTAVDWIKLNIVSTETNKLEGIKELPRQPTAVCEHFPPPGKLTPVAILMGTGGVVNGKQYPIERDNYLIGRNPENDLAITGDDFVSGCHASIKYDNGALFLCDQGSRNGTFLNGKQVASSAVSIRRGDTIRLGNSILQVTEA